MRAARVGLTVRYISVRVRAGVKIAYARVDDKGTGGDEREGSFEKHCVGESYPCTCAGQRTTQLSIFAAL